MCSPPPAAAPTVRCPPQSLDPQTSHVYPPPLPAAQPHINWKLKMCPLSFLGWIFTYKHLNIYISIGYVYKSFLFLKIDPYICYIYIYGNEIDKIDWFQDSAYLAGKCLLSEKKNSLTFSPGQRFFPWAAALWIRVLTRNFPKEKSSLTDSAFQRPSIIEIWMAPHNFCPKKCGKTTNWIDGGLFRKLIFVIIILTLSLSL